MRYIRNSGRKPKPEKKKKEEKGLTPQMENDVTRQLLADAKWLNSLNESDQFSREWIQKVMLELLLQCMGKKEIVTTNMFGTQIVARMFKEKGAIQVASILAKMEGHLFDVTKATVTQTGAIEHKHEVKLLPEPDRSGSVLDILMDCGAFNVPVKRLTKDDVEIISA